MNKINNDDESDGNKKLKNQLSFKNIKNLVKFKSLKNFARYKKLFKKVIKFKTFKKFCFLAFNSRLVFNQLRQVF